MGFWELSKQIKKAIKNYHTVYSAGDNEKLVGLINSLSDGVMTVFHYLLVQPEYQGMGIGRELIKLMLQNTKILRGKLLLQRG